MSRSPRSTERPNLPEPEAFGLSTTRVQHFDRPVGQYFFDRLTHQPIFWIVYLSGLFLLIYVSTESLVASFFILFFAWLLPLFVLAALLMLVDALWRRLQSDYPRYRDYQRAIEQHKIALAEWLRTQKDWWQSLSGYTFEAEIGRVFGKRGYTVKRVGGAGDQGVDLLLAKDGVTIVVQCKAHNKPIGPGAVRDLYGTLLHHQYREAWLVSSCGFTKGAAAFAANKPIRLIGVDELL